MQEVENVGERGRVHFVRVGKDIHLSAVGGGGGWGTINANRIKIH
jgi:hypothetical protein